MLNCIQIIINSEKKRISIGESIDPAHWDKRMGLANKKGYAVLNSLINKRKSDIEVLSVIYKEIEIWRVDGGFDINKYEGSL